MTIQLRPWQTRDHEYSLYIHCFIRNTFGIQPFRYVRLYSDRLFQWQITIVQANPFCSYRSPTFFAMTAKSAMKRADKKLIEYGYEFISEERMKKLELLL